MNSIPSARRLVQSLALAALVGVGALAAGVALDIFALPLFCAAAGTLILLVLVRDYAPRPAERALATATARALARHPWPLAA